MSDEALFLEVVICLATIDIALLIFQFFHRLLLEDLMPAFSLQSLRHCRYTLSANAEQHKHSGIRTGHSILNLRNLVEVLGVGQAEGAHTKSMSRFLEVPLEIFPVRDLCQSSRHTCIA